MGFLDLFNPFSSGSPLSALTGDYGLLSNPTGAWDKFKNGNTNDVNYAVAQDNLKFQRENLEYQKALQEKIFEREDSAYSRTVADMRNAGLSPLTMQGTNGAGEAIATQAPQLDYKHSDIGGLNALSQILSMAQSFRMNEESIREKELSNDLAEDTYESDILFKRANLISQYYDNMDKTRKEEFNRFFGIHSGMSDEERKMQIYAHAFGLGSDIALNIHDLPIPLRRHGKFDEYFNSVNDLFSGSTNYYVNPDTYSKLFSGKQILQSGLDYASQFLSLFNKFRNLGSSKKGKNNNKDDNLDWLPF